MAIALRDRLIRWLGAGDGRASANTSLMHGGIVNTQTGMGTSADKSEHSFYLPTRIWSRQPLEILYVQAWAAGKFIDIPIDDMLIFWRQWAGDAGDAAIQAMVQADQRHHVANRIRRAMKAGRLFGSSLLVMVTREADMETPLVPERIRPGDLVGLHVFDRYSASVWQRDDDLMSAGYGSPVYYDVHPRRGLGMRVHESRVIRFNGIESLVSDGFTSYDFDWSVSSLVPAILAVMQDHTVATAAAHLSQVASIPVLAIDGLREALASQYTHEASATDIAEQVNRMMSVYRILMLDKGSEEFTRVAVNFAGIDKVIDRIERRLAAAAGIPITRFYSASPAGMNATGESDWRNYVTMIEAKREEMLADPLRRLDAVLARDAGVMTPPECSWRSLLEMSQAEIAAAALALAQAGREAIEAGMIDEDEGREALSSSDAFGPLPGMAPGLPEPEPAPMPATPGGGR